jgi:hypothetical protein
VAVVVGTDCQRRANLVGCMATGALPWTLIEPSVGAEKGGRCTKRTEKDQHQVITCDHLDFIFTRCVCSAASRVSTPHCTPVCTMRESPKFLMYLYDTREGMGGGQVVCGDMR